MFKFKTHEEDPSLMNAFKNETSSCWLTLSNRVSFFEQDESGQKIQCATKSLVLLLEKKNHLNNPTVQFGQCISTKSDPFVRSIPNYVLANSIRTC